jgi:hypothetical protein
MIVIDPGYGQEFLSSPGSGSTGWG